MLADYLSFVPELSAQVHKRTPAAVEMALRLEDAERAHLELDRIGVPREIGGWTASLMERVSYLGGMLSAAKLYIALKEGQ